MQAEEAHEMKSGSDILGSRDSVTSREPCSHQQKLQPVPLVLCVKDAALTPRSERNIKHYLLELASPRSHAAKSVQYGLWDSQPQLSKPTEAQPDSRPSF